MTVIRNTEKRIKILLALVLIPIGIFTKYYSGPCGEFVNNHLGGIIYVVFWILLFSILFPKYPIFKLVFLVLLVTCCIELTQMIQHPFLSYFRKNFFFRALFGNTYNPVDFLYYFGGALIGFIAIYFIKQIEGKKSNISRLE